MGLIFKKSTAQPAFTVAAAITGTVQVGETLTCAYTATKARASNVTVRWYRYTNTDAPGELIGTGATYTLTGNEQDFLVRAIVEASNPAGTVQSPTAYTARVTTAVSPDAPVIQEPAAITGTLEVGQTLTVSYDFIGEDSVAIQWASYSASSGGISNNLGTATTQVLGNDEDGKWIDCQVTATNASGETVSVAPRVGPISVASSTAPVFTSAANVKLDDGADGFNEGEWIVCDFTVTGATSTPTVKWYKCDAGKTNAEELVDAGTTCIKPLPVSEPNSYRASLFLNQSLSLNSGSKQVYAIATAVNSEAPSGVTSESGAVGPIGAIQGTAISAANKAADGIIYLDTADTTYYLSEDITFDGPGIVLSRSGVKLNGNGKTITYDNKTYPTITNAGFATGSGTTATGWDFTNAGDTGASIYDPADKRAAMLANLIFDDADGKSLIFTDCTESGYVESDEIVLAANTTYTFGCHMHYGEGSQINNPGVFGYARLIDQATGDPIEGRNPYASGTDGTYMQGVAFDPSPWVSGRTYWSGGSGVNYGGFCTYDNAVWACATSNSDAVFDANKWTIRRKLPGHATYHTYSAATTYAIDDIVWYYGYEYKARTASTGASILNTGAWTRLSPVLTFQRGIQRSEFQFTTGGSSVTVKIRLGIDGHVEGTNKFVFDALTLGGLRCHGVCMNMLFSSPWFYYPSHNSSYARTSASIAAGQTLKNVTITQAGNSPWSHAVLAGAMAGTCRIHRVNATCQGANCSVIWGHSMTGLTQTSELHDCVLTSNVRALTSRDNANGCMVFEMRGTAARNTLYNGAGQGMAYRARGSSIYGNHFYMKNKYTNGAAMIAASTNDDAVGMCYVYDNYIHNNEGDYGGPGIFLSGLDPTECWNNIVESRLLGNNNEYGTNTNGDLQNGCYAVQLEKAQNKDFHDNVVTSSAQWGEAACVRIGGNSTYTHAPNRVYRNTLTALLGTQEASVPASRAINSCFRLTIISKTQNDGLEIYENTCVCDSSPFAESGNTSYVTFARNSWSQPDTLGISYIMRKAGTPPTNIEFRDNIYADAGAAQIFENGRIWDSVGVFVGDYRITWTIAFQASEAVEGLTVTVLDKDGATAATTTTNSQGRATLVITESYHPAAGIINYNSGAGYTVNITGAYSGSASFVADSVKTVNVTVS